MTSFKKVMVLAAALLIGLQLLAGCNMARKPAPQNPPEAQAPAPAAPSNQAMPDNAEEVNQIAERLTETAAQVPGVERAVVVIAGTTAYVGVDQKEDMGGADTEKVKRDVSNEVKKAEPRLTAVYVSSDPDVTARLRSIADGVAAGKPLSTFDNELSEITKRISPTSR